MKMYRIIENGVNYSIEVFEGNESDLKDSHNFERFDECKSVALLLIQNELDMINKSLSRILCSNEEDLIILN